MPTKKKTAAKKTSPNKVVKKTVAKKATKKVAVKKVAKKVLAKKVVKKTTAKKGVKSSRSKKSVAKKAAKKTTAPTQTKKPLVTASNDQSFWVTNGAVLNSLIALRDALDEMEKEVYSYHVSKEHNDFASWVDAVLCDAECAAELKRAQTPVKARTVVTRHLKVYSV